MKLQAQIGQSMFGPHPATSLLCAGLIALSLSGCADTYYAETYYTPESRYDTYYGPDKSVLPVLQRLWRGLLLRILSWRVIRSFPPAASPS